MNDILVEQRHRSDGAQSRSRTRRVMRGLGWLLMVAGVVVLLYLVYSLFYTNLINDRSQDSLLEQWERDVGPTDGAAPIEPGAQPAADEPAAADEGDSSVEAGLPGADAPVELGDAYAVMWFERPGSDERPVHPEPLAVVEGSDPESLKRGPGHYPGTAGPGEPGNFAVAGHRTTYGAPFYHLDQLQPGDEIHVVDRQRRRWRYEVVDRRVVLPSDTWVIGPDPLGTGQPIMSLTTCEPRFSAAKRLMVFAELRNDGEA